MSVKNFPKVPRVYIDMDGPIADFIRLNEFVGEHFSTFKLRKGVYRNLPATHGAVTALTELNKLEREGLIQTWVLSKIPDQNPEAATEKLHWLREMLPGVFGERIIISPDKAAIGTDEDVLIEDHPHWANAHNFRGVLLQWHRHGDRRNNWAQVVRDVKSLVHHGIFSGVPLLTQYKK